MNKKYFLFNKPYGVLSQFTPEDGNKSLSEFDFPKDIYPAGRLDKNSEGLLLLTNDGNLINKIINPLSQKEKTYLAQVEKIPKEEDLEKMRKGLKLKSYQTLPCKVKIIESPVIPPRNPPIRERKNIPTCWLEVKLKEGKNHQVRKMTAAIGYPTLRLIRVAIHNLTLGELKAGQSKEIKRSDIKL